MGVQQKTAGALGFDFTGNVESIKKSFSYLQGAVDSTWGKFKDLKGGLREVSSSILKDVGDLAKKGAQGLGALSRGIDGMVDRAMNPDVPFDSMASEFNKSFHAMTVGMNIAESETKKWQSAIVGAHYATGESMEDMGKGFIEARKQGVDLERALGTKGMSGTVTRLAKITSVFGIDSAKLTNTYAVLKKQFNVSEDAAKSYGDRIFTIGKVFNIGREAVQQWPDMIGDLSKEFADLGKKASPEDIKRFSESIVTLGGSISTALGKPAEESIGLSRQLFSILAGNKRGIQDMFRGMGGEIGRLGMQVVETGGSVDDMFALINKDPEKFMEGLQRLGRSTKASSGEMGLQFQRLVGSINQTLGPDVTNLMRANWGKVNERLKEIPKALKGSSDAMGKAAEEHHRFAGSGNAVEMMLQRFNMRMFGLVQKDYGSWIGNLGKGFQKTGDTVAKLAEDKGPVGGLTRRLLLMQRVGLSGLFTQTSKAGTAFGVFATQATGALGALNKLGIRLSDLPTLLATGGPIMLGFALFDKGLRKDLIGGVQAGAKWMREKGPGEFKKAAAGIGGVWRELVSDLGPVFSELSKGVQKYAPLAGDAVMGMLNSIDWTSVGQGIGVAGEGMVKVLFSAASRAAPMALKTFAGVVWGGGAGGALGHVEHFGILAGTLLAKRLWDSPDLRKKAFTMFKDVAGLSKMPFKGVANNWKGTTVAMVAAGAWFAENMGDEWEQLRKDAHDKNRSIGDNFGDVMGFMTVAAMKFANQVTGGALEHLVGGFDGMQKKLRVYWKAFGTFFKDVWYSILDSVAPGVMKFLHTISLGKLFDDKDFAELSARTAAHRAEISSEQIGESRDLAAVDLETARTTANAGIASAAASNLPSVSRPARGGAHVPDVKHPSPVAAPAQGQVYAAQSSQMAAQLAGMGQQLAAMAQRPIQVDLHLDGRRFGTAMYKQAADAAAFAHGNSAGRRV